MKSVGENHLNKNESETQLFVFLSLVNQIFLN